MTAPKINTINNLPEQGMVPTTYSQFVDKLNCSCGGAIIRPSPIPSATKNLGDIITDQLQSLSAFASSYSMIVVIIRMIACMMEVMCALMNPFSVIRAIIKLFGTCLPEFILIFPQFTIPSIISCLLKIIISVLEYILTVIIPLIEDILSNIEMLRSALTRKNADAQVAIAFKIVSLFKELQNIIGILSAMLAIWEMVKALIKLGVALPCGDSDDNDCCNELNCPGTIRNNTELTGGDGILSVNYNFGVPKIYFTAPSIINELKSITDFFPSGFDYVNVSDKNKLPYVLNIDNSSFAVSKIDGNGTATLLITDASYFADGYLLNTDVSGLPLPSTAARFYSPSATFNTYSYIILQDTRGSEESSNNNGTFMINYIYNTHNVLLQKTGTETWSYYTTNNDLKWTMAPQGGMGKPFELEINHNELVRHNLIGIGCHPAVRATLNGVDNRFPQLRNTVLPELPDLQGLINRLNVCLSSVAPLDLDSNWVLNNYESMESNIGTLSSCVTGNLNSFKTDVLNYSKDLINNTIDVENSQLFASPSVQMIGNYVDISVIPVDRNGANIALGLPTGMISVQFTSSEGVTSYVSESNDGYGMSTGIFTATLISDIASVIQIGASVNGNVLSYFDGAELQPRFVSVQFVEPSDFSNIIGGSPEPLGVLNG